MNLQIVEFNQPSDWPVQPEYTALAVSYSAGRMVMDEVLRRTTVGRLEGRYTDYNIADSFEIPDTRVGRLSEPNRYQPGGKPKSFTCETHGLQTWVPMADETGTFGPTDPVARAVGVLTGMLRRAREDEGSKALTLAATYPASNQATLAGNAQWSDHVNSNPVTAIGEAAESMIVMPDSLVVSGSVWAKLRSHPKLVSAVFGNDGTSGIVNAMQAADALELERVIVARGRKNAANPGQDVTPGYIWGRDAVLFRAAETDLDPELSEPRLGFTPTYMGGLEVLMETSNRMGAGGATGIIVRESRCDVIAATRAGYLFKNAVA